jgi:ADP-ribose pyrophosphatase
MIPSMKVDAVRRTLLDPCQLRLGAVGTTSRGAIRYHRLRLVESGRRVPGAIMNDAETLNSERVYAGKVFNVDRDRVKLPNGRVTTVEVVRHSRSVVIIPVPEPGKIILIKQFRYPVGRFLWELPAGSVDEGETPVDAARRECHEEIGLVPSTVVRLSALYPTPGYCDEEMIFFRASALEKTDAQAHVDEDEDIDAKTFELREARDMVRRGEIVDMKTVVALTLL